MTSKDESQKITKSTCYDFVSIISHQLRTPLTFFKWSLEEMLSNNDQDYKYKEQLNDMHLSVDQIILLINSLSNFSRIETGDLVADKKPIDAIELINNSIKLFQPVARKKNQRIIIITKGDSLLIKADPLLISEAMKNLLDNAIKYGYENSNIEIILRRDNEKCVVGVHNYGSTIGKFENDKIFSKFYRGKNAQDVKVPGSGLGLFIARSLIRANDGDVWYESKDMGGTTFYFSVPVASDF